jgi:signal transduction histidine kinase
MMRFESETSGATSDSRPTTWWSPPFKVRLAGFGLAVATFGFLIVGFDTHIWRAQAHLKEGFMAIKAEKFYFGVNFRVNFRKLTATLLDFHLTGKSADLETFHHDAYALKDWLRTKELSFVAPSERAAFTRLESAYDEFLAHVDSLLSANSLPPSVSESFAAAYSQIRQEAHPVLKACDDVVQAEHGEFDVFLQNSDQALISLQRLFLMSLLLLVALAVALAVLVYRGMLAPLRARLSESQTIIERQEKLAALGTLGAGVAHEIRNPLTAIKFRLFSLQKALPPDLAENEDARIISEELNRLDRIVKDFLQFARPSEPELVRVPAERILLEVRDFLESQLNQAAIDLKLEILHPAWIFADTQQLKQVLINLIQNSAESIGKNGVITILLKAGTAAFAGKVRPATILAVVDTGRGIPAEVQKRLFDPFFTTKQNGTGLGLAIAARIIERHGGVLHYRTEVNRGTTFEIVLPAIGDDATKNITR